MYAEHGMVEVQTRQSVWTILLMIWLITYDGEMMAGITQKDPCSWFYMIAAYISDSSKHHHPRFVPFTSPSYEKTCRRAPNWWLDTHRGGSFTGYLDRWQYGVLLMNCMDNWWNFPAFIKVSQPGETFSAFHGFSRSIGLVRCKLSLQFVEKMWCITLYHHVSAALFHFYPFVVDTVL
jgi:hypothetical protein